jgi:hypothetical protein
MHMRERMLNSALHTVEVNCKYVTCITRQNVAKKNIISLTTSIMALKTFYIPQNGYS